MVFSIEFVFLNHLKIKYENRYIAGQILKF